LKKLLLVCLVASIALAKETPKAKPFDPVDDINKPRPDARHVMFTTGEATWSSVDLSPDGQTLLFDILGDIYTVPVAGAIPLDDIHNSAKVHWVVKDGVV
jgi:hypothetical protein